jgi:hypothetical protein
VGVGLARQIEDTYAELEAQIGEDFARELCETLDRLLVKLE